MNEIINQSDNPLQDYKISPEIFEVATEYVKHLDIASTAKALGIGQDEVVTILDKKEVKRYIDAIFLQQGFMQRDRLNDVMTDVINMKLEEMNETGLGSNKDILEILRFQHQMRMDYLKLEKESAASVKNQQINMPVQMGGDNYTALMQKILETDKDII